MFELRAPSRRAVRRLGRDERTRTSTPEEDGVLTERKGVTDVSREEEVDRKEVHGEEVTGEAQDDGSQVDRTQVDGEEVHGA